VNAVSLLNLNCSFSSHVGMSKGRGEQYYSAACQGAMEEGKVRKANAEFVA
jgi:hypothetical protein